MIISSKTKVNNAKIKLKGTEKLELIGSLATMISSGISLFEIVRTLEQDAKGGQKVVLSEMLEDLSQGRQIHVTFAKFPRIFDKVSVNVIRAAEEAGTLDKALTDLRSTLQKQMEFSDKIRSALMYPAFIVVVFIGILFMILVVVVPKISTVFRSLNVPLPLPTRMLMFASDLILKNTIPFVLTSGLIIIGLYYLFTRQRKAIMELLYRLPVVSDLITQIDVTNFARNFSVLLSSGLPITQALELVSEVVVRKKMANMIVESRKMVLAGKPLSLGLKETKDYMPNIVIKLVEAGEKTGTLDKSLAQISDYFDYKVGYTLKTLTAMMEPIMLVVVGICVGGMMMAIIAPIYGIIGQVGTR